jgi:low temperature requirement protein LtrA
LRFILVAEYLWVGRKLPQASPLTNRYSLGFGLAATIWLISAFVPDPYRFLLWGIALLIDFLTPFTAGEIHINFPPHPTHLPERFGLFSIIVIGEAILSLEVAVSNIGTDFITELMGLMGLIIAFSLWWGYFEEAGGAEERVQDRGDQIAKYQLWLYSHFPFMVGVVGAAAGIKHVISLPYGFELPSSDTWLMCLSLAVALISISLIFISSFKWEDCRSKVLLNYRMPYYIVIALVIATGFLSTVVSGFTVLLILTILCILNVVISLRETPEAICEL